MYIANGMYEDASAFFQKAKECIEKFRDMKKGRAKNFWRSLHAAALEGLATCSMKQKKADYQAAVQYARPACDDHKFLIEAGWDVNKGENTLTMFEDRLMVCESLDKLGKAKEALAELDAIDTSSIRKSAQGASLTASMLAKKADLIERLGMKPQEYLPVYDEAYGLMKNSIGDSPTLKKLGDLIARKKKALSS